MPDRSAEAALGPPWAPACAVSHPHIDTSRPSREPWWFWLIAH
jgi:hypothetical protein